MNHIIPVPKKYDVITESFHSLPLSIHTEVAVWQDYLDPSARHFIRSLRSSCLQVCPAASS